MNFVGGPSWLTLLVIVVLVIVVLKAIAASGRVRANGRGPRACARCGAMHPGHARFCRRCGSELPPG